jgi:hypothetical protein
MPTSDKTASIMEEVIKLTRSSDFNREKIAKARSLLQQIPDDDPDKEQILQWMEEAIGLTERLV